MHAHSKNCPFTKRPYGEKGIGLRCGEQTETLNSRIGKAGTRSYKMSRGGFMDCVTMLLVDRAEVSNSRTPYILSKMLKRAENGHFEIQHRIDLLTIHFNLDVVDEDGNSTRSIAGPMTLEPEVDKTKITLAGVLLEEEYFNAAQPSRENIGFDVKISQKISTTLNKLRHRKTRLVRDVKKVDPEFNVGSWISTDDYHSCRNAHIQQWQTKLQDDILDCRNQIDASRLFFSRGHSQFNHGREKAANRRKINRIRKKMSCTVEALKSANEYAKNKR